MTSRREFAGLAMALATRPRPSASTNMDGTLRDGIERRRIPAVAAAVAGPEKMIYTGAFGRRDSRTRKCASIPSSASRQ